MSVLLFSYLLLQLQWNFSNPNILGTDRFVRIREVFELGKFLFKITKFPNFQIPNFQAVSNRRMWPG